jgi:hypothetical protein
MNKKVALNTRVQYLDSYFLYLFHIFCAFKP